MAYDPILGPEYNVGKALKRDLWRKTAENLEDHENRINALSLGAAPVVVFNNDILNASSALSLTGLAYYRSYVQFTITTVKLQIFQKGIVTSGILSLDIKKGSTLDDLSMASILNTEPQINFATAVDYAESDGVLNPTEQLILPNQYLRLDITSLPALPVGAFRVLVYGNV